MELSKKFPKFCGLFMRDLLHIYAIVYASSHYIIVNEIIMLKANRFQRNLFFCCLWFVLISSLQFAGHHFTDVHWKELKETVNCWTEKGQWIPVDYGYSYNDSLSIEENYEKLAPCVMRLGKLSSVCIPMPYNTVALNFTWDANECTKPLLPFSALSWCKFPHHLRNIFIIGDSLSADHSGFTFMNEIVRSLDVPNKDSYCNSGPAFGLEGGSFSALCPANNNSNHTINDTKHRIGYINITGTSYSILLLILFYLITYLHRYKK